MQFRIEPSDALRITFYGFGIHGYRMAEWQGFCKGKEKVEIGDD